MGYKEWRQRQLDRVDAMTAWADKTDQRLAAEKEARGQQQAVRETPGGHEQPAAQGAGDPLAALAALLGEDHDDLVRRAKAVGMDEYVQPEPGLVERSSRAANKLRWAVPLASLTLPHDAGDGGRQTPGPYEAWRDRIVLEEAAAAKLARGEQLSRLDRATLKIARYASK